MDRASRYVVAREDNVVRVIYLGQSANKSRQNPTLDYENPRLREGERAASEQHIVTKFAAIHGNRRRHLAVCFSRRARKKARSVDMKRASIGATSFAGSTA
jgi:hypothetical protein